MEQRQPTAEKKMFNEAFEVLERYYNRTQDAEAWEEFSREYMELLRKYKSPLWNELIDAVANHLGRKEKYEKDSKK